MHYKPSQRYIEDIEDDFEESVTPVLSGRKKREPCEANSVAAQQSMHSDYIFANKGKEAPIRFAALAAIYDPQPIRHLETLGVGCGWRCLEVGAGSGTIAKWPADRVAPRVCVLVSDVGTRFLEPLRGPTLEVRAHDIGSDPLPDAEFDLIHTHLVLMHVGERDTALARIVSSLKAGDWLLVEEYDTCSIRPDPTLSSDEELLPTHIAMLKLLEDGGGKLRSGRLLHGLLREKGLTSVGASAQLFMWHRGSPGIAMMRANFEQLREAMIEANYITPQQFDEDLARLNDPSLMMPSSILWSGWGRRS